MFFSIVLSFSKPHIIWFGDSRVVSMRLAFRVPPTCIVVLVKGKHSYLAVVVDFLLFDLILYVSSIIFQL